MTRKEAKEILIDHNKWRRAQGQYDKVGAQPLYTAKEVGEAIDYAIKVL